jgi:hypothetical protein
MRSGRVLTGALLAQLRDHIDMQMAALGLHDGRWPARNLDRDLAACAKRGHAR